MPQMTHEQLVEAVGGKNRPKSDEFRELIRLLDNHQILAKVFILEGIPFVFENSPMKYVIFREQVADRFGIGSQDVCIVGSAKLGFSPSAHKFGQPFSETSDVDVVVISELLFQDGSTQLFTALNGLGPPLYGIRAFLQQQKSGTAKEKPPVVELEDWRSVKEALRNYVYGNFNPGLLPYDHPLRNQIFNSIASTAGLFLALEPRVFVSKIRCRVFRTWKAAEAYYTNSLRELHNSFLGRSEATFDEEVEDVTDEETSLA
jgi:hypothetical protein